MFFWCAFPVQLAECSHSDGRKFVSSEHLLRTIQRVVLLGDPGFVSQHDQDIFFVLKRPDRLWGSPSLNYLDFLSGGKAAEA